MHDKPVHDDRKNKKPRPRFPLIAVFVVTAIVAGMAFTARLVLDWNNESPIILREYNRVRAADGPTIAIHKLRGAHYAIANVPCRIDSKNPGEVVRHEVTEEDDLRRRSGEVWITPPGEWVTEPSRAIYLLVNNL